MIRFEDIIDDAKRYVQGKMDKEQRTAFEILMSNNPHIKEEIELMGAMVQVMQELPEDEVNARFEGSEGKPITSVGQGSPAPKWPRWFVLALVLVVLVLLITRFLDHPFRKEIVNRVPESGLSTFGSPDLLGLRENISTSLTIGPNGNLYICGNFYREIRLSEFVLQGDSLSTDFFIASLTPQLDVRWAKAYGSVGDDYIKSIAVDHMGAILFTGILGDTIEFDSILLVPKSDRVNGQARDIFIAKMGLDREIEWVQSEGGQNRPYVSSGGGALNAIDIDLDNQIYAIGSFSNSTIWGFPLETTKATNSFLVKFSSFGQILWLRPLIGEYGVKILSLDQDGSNIALSGFFGHAAYDGDLLIGNEVLTSMGGSDLFVALYDTSGELHWVQQAGSPLRSKTGLGEAASTVALDNDFNTIISGYFAGVTQFGPLQLNAVKGRDIFISKLNKDGDFLWAKQAGGGSTDNDPNTASPFDAATSTAVDPHGNIYVCGFFSNSSIFENDTLQPRGAHDIFISKYDPGGSMIWVKQLGGDNSTHKGDYAHKLVVDENGICYVSGFFSGELVIEDYRLESKDHLNIFIVALDANGNIREFNQMLYANL